MNKKIEARLNAQIKLEMESSYIYLAMASWAHQKGFDGISTFFYEHSDEERMHMLKIVKFVNERDGEAIIPDISVPKLDYSENNLTKLFQDVYDHEVKVSDKIHELVALSLEEKDYATHNFLQWYVTEQMEEESMVKTLLDKLKIIGEDRAGLYLFDRDIATTVAPIEGQQA